MNTLKMLVGLSLLMAAAGCSTDADVASQNLSIAADNFQIERRIIFIDTWTDTYLLSITGLCSIKSAEGTTGTPGVAVTCKVGANEYKKHYLGLSGNVTYFSEQVGPAQVGVYRYKVVFKPSVILPDIDMR
jgi:hypothetical protein